VSNRAAQTFIAASGFRRTRILQLPDGRETLVHYRVVREWFEAACDGRLPPRPANDAGLAPYRPLPGAARGSDRALPPAESAQAVPTPPGWTPIDEAGAPRWIDAAATAFLRGLADSVPDDAGREDVVKTLFFEAAHGTQFFGRAASPHDLPHPAATAQALISVKPLPRRPGWWLLRGGPLSADRAPVSLRPWLDACFAQATLRRVEAQVPADRADSLAWWRACGLPDEGITEIDRHGQPLAYTLARVAT